MNGTDQSVQTLKPIPELDYYDQRSTRLPVAVTPIEAWNIMAGGQKPVLQFAFKIRDIISSKFGVKRIGGFSGTKIETVEIGDQLDFFLVEDVSPEMLILTARDRHLDVMICLSVAHPVLTVTASVVTHNFFGRMYMLPVGPAHKFIVARELKRLTQRLGRLPRQE